MENLKGEESSGGQRKQKVKKNPLLAAQNQLFRVHLSFNILFVPRRKCSEQQQMFRACMWQPQFIFCTLKCATKSNPIAGSCSSHSIRLSLPRSRSNWPSAGDVSMSGLQQNLIHIYIQWGLLQMNIGLQPK